MMNAVAAESAFRTITNSKESDEWIAIRSDMILEEFHSYLFETYANDLSPELEQLVWEQARIPC